LFLVGLFHKQPHTRSGAVRSMAVFNLKNISSTFALKNLSGSVGKFRNRSTGIEYWLHPDEIESKLWSRDATFTVEPHITFRLREAEGF